MERAERQKAERLRKQLKKRLDKATEADEKSKIEEEFHIADVDYHYARYFPFLERYVSLYAAARPEGDSGEGPIAKRSLHSERPPMWKEIEAAMEAGQSALVKIQERRSGTSATADGALAAVSEENEGGKPPGKEAKKSRAEPKMNSERRRMTYGREAEEQSGDDSDGSGFFD